MTLDTGRRVLAAIDDSPAAAPVLAATRAIASLLEARPDAIHVRVGGTHTAAAVAGRGDIGLRIVDGDPATEILRAAAEPDVSLVVVGTRALPAGARPAGHITCSVLGKLDIPVLVVPPDAQRPGPGSPFRRALIPLEGTEPSSEAVADLLDRLSAAGVELVGVHVFGPATAPAFWDQSAHAGSSWTDQFVSRWCAGADIDLHLRRGPPADTVARMADEQEVDLVVLGWSQDMGPGRAAVVQGTLATVQVPVLLVPTPASS